jgi:glucokinase
MNQGYPRLLGDIGGTNVRWAWQESAASGLEDISVQPCVVSASLQDSAIHYLASHERRSPMWAGMGVATTVTGDDVRFTNNSWQFSISGFQKALSLERCLVINDFTALALSLPALKPHDVRSIGGGDAVAGAPIALLGPGTGLGVSGLVPDASGHCRALAGEGGHVTLAATDDLQATLLGVLRNKFQHVSAERVLSGAGLVNLYQAICSMQGCRVRELQPSDVTDGAVAGTDAQCVLAVKYFTQFLGNVAGNLALTLGSKGGVYIGGGIVPRLGTTFDDVLFRESFEDKGRYRSMLSEMPIWVITAQTPALMGASRALDTLP